MNKLKVAVLVSYYNGHQYIEEQIESLLNQKGVMVDIYIRNDGSTCNLSIDKLTYLKNKYNDLVVFDEDNIGVVKSFYRLLSVVDGYDYYAFCDQDDFWLDFKLNRASSKIKNNEPTLYCSSYDLVDKKLDKINCNKNVVYNDFLSALFKNYCTGCTCVINSKLRNIIINQYFFDSVPMHDWWFILVAHIEGYVIYDELPTILYRQHESNVVGGGHSFKKKFIRYCNNIYNRSTVRSDLAKLLLDNTTKNNDKTQILYDLLESKHSFRKKVSFIKENNILFSNKLDSISVYISILLGRY